MSNESNDCNLTPVFHEWFSTVLHLILSMNGGDGQKEVWLAAMESFSAFICSSTGMTFFLFNFKVPWRTFSVFCWRKNAFLYIHWQKINSIWWFECCNGQRLAWALICLRLHNPSYKSCDTLCVYPVDMARITFSMLIPLQHSIKINRCCYCSGCLVYVHWHVCSPLPKCWWRFSIIHYTTKVNTDWLKFIGGLSPWHLMSSSDLTDCCTPVSCRNLWISQMSFFSSLPLEHLNRSLVSFPAGIRKIFAELLFVTPCQKP